MKTFVLTLMSMFLVGMTGDFTDALVRLCGLEGTETLTEDLVEDYSRLLKHPIDINSASEQQLRSTGFFTSFQIASIRDYIKRNGPIVSYAELAGITGIGKQMADDLRFFFSCGQPGGAMIGKEKKKRLLVEGSMRNTIKSGMRVSSKAKCEATYGQQFGAGLSIMGETAKGYLSYSMEKFPIKVVLGSFNARYGQGLLLWSGFSIGGVSQLSGFSRNSTGVNASLSSSSIDGIAVSWAKGRSCIDACALYAGGIAVHYGYRTQRGTYAMTAICENGYWGYSLDYKMTMRKVTAFGELALYKGDGMGTAFLGGAFYNIGYRKRVGVLLRYYSDEYTPLYCGSIHSGTTPSGEKGIGTGVEYEKVSFVADYSNRQCLSLFRSMGKWIWDKSLGEWQLDGELRHIVKYNEKNSYYSNELRAEVNASRERFQLSTRLQMLKGKSSSILGYCECGFKSEKMRLAARALSFNAKEWEDRLYAYTRDVPGSFSVPVYYGRGCEVSFYARFENMALRLSYTSYRGDKVDKWEVKGYIAF